MPQALLPKVESELIKPWYRLRFSPAVESRFEEDTSARRSRHLVLTGIVTLSIYDLFLINDNIFRPETLAISAWVRLGVMTPLALAALYCVSRNLTPAMREATMAATVILAMLLSNVIFFASKAPYSFLDTFAFGLIPLVSNVIFSLRFAFAAATSLICTLIMAVFVVLYQPMAFEIKVYTLVLFTANVVFTLLANFRLESSERKSYLLLLRERLRNQVALEDNQTLTKISATDPLTGVANRRHFDSVLAQRWEEAIARQTMLGILVIDIDYFKNYNDRYGHLQGDHCLRHVALEIQQHVRHEDDLVVRFGGEEFVVLLPHVSVASAYRAAEHIRQGIEALGLPNEGAPHKPMVTVSIGAAVTQPAEGMAPSALLRHADEALYQAKGAGRNRSVLAPLEGGPVCA
ncbi:diguanylate cyclase [Franzmannia qiaohouensis]|uniref:diguanylate cyclase n=1 Tax=Franzmannia qiaohouensis TaxID=1329370 RepID=A0ABU1HGB9_9GAMM|nr:diguanylate cyclase [Halomonas qiaohouensis]MDR5906512.1 GGDEF domain-containing protein [Halomonas qiaohouensis]